MLLGGDMPHAHQVKDHASGLTPVARTRAGGASGTRTGTRTGQGLGRVIGVPGPIRPGVKRPGPALGPALDSPPVPVPATFDPVDEANFLIPIRVHMTSIPLLRFRLLDGLPHGVSSRLGGVSGGKWSSLNLSEGSGDDRERVLENRRRFASSAGVEAAAVTSIHQVHSATVRVVGPAERGTGYVGGPPRLPDGDGLVTRTPGAALVAKSADCPLVLLADRTAGVVGVVHAGWRGTLEGIVPAGVRTMRELGADPARIVAGLAPCAGPCCYEVKGDVIAKFLAAWPHSYRFLETRENRRFLDLRAAIREQLAAAGVAPDRVETAEACTICDPERRFYSYRRDGPGCGHQGAMIGLP